MKEQQVIDWSVAIFVARETPVVLQETLVSILAATNRRSVIDVLVNGNLSLVGEAERIIKSIGSKSGESILRLWYIPLGDKANAFNCYLHGIFPQSRFVYFVDGYARPNRDAFSLLENGLNEHPEAWCAAGVPSIGAGARSSRIEQIAVHGIHGNLFCIPQRVINLMRDKGFSLPIGLYRTDSTIGAVIKYSLDPANNSWDNNRIYVHPEASWKVDKKTWWRYSDIVGQFKRVLRQAKGDLENRALRHHFTISKRLPNQMPSNVVEMINAWIEENPAEASDYLRNPLRMIALEYIRKSQPVSVDSTLPRLIWSSD